MELRLHRITRLAAGVLAALILAAAAHAQEATAPAAGKPLRVAVYDAAPYGSLQPNGLFSGVSVDLWRRVAEDRRWQYEFQSVASMDDILNGLEHGTFD